jgi:hypothetical protein
VIAAAAEDGDEMLLSVTLNYTASYAYERITGDEDDCTFYDDYYQFCGPAPTRRRPRWARAAISTMPRHCRPVPRIGPLSLSTAGPGLRGPFVAEFGEQIPAPYQLLRGRDADRKARPGAACTPVIWWGCHPNVEVARHEG